MINLGKALIILRNQQKFSPSIHTNSNLHKFIKKNYLSTSQNKSKKSSDKIDLRSEFQDMINETKISEEEVQNTNKEEQIKLKHSMDQAKKDFDAKQENLKNEWEKNRHSNAEEDKDSEIKINHIKKKFTSAFFFNKEKPQGKEEQGGKNSNDKNDEEEKNPESLEPSKFSKFVSGFAKVWRETFPGEENVELLLEKRKLEAQILKSKIKEPTEEEIQQIEESIPEWKRGAVVFVMDQPAEETVSFFDVAKRNLKSHVKNLKIYKEAQESLQNSEISLLVEDLKTSYTNVRENLKESQNPFFVVSRDLIDRVNFKSPSSLATQVMRKHDPNFELVLFEKEVDAIFKQLMMAYVKDDLDTVRLVAGDMALAVLTNDIKSRRERVRLYIKIYFKIY
jgi:hypothetical protein